MAPFHQTLERFFRKNFLEEITRLGLEEHQADFTSTLLTRSGQNPSSPSLFTGEVEFSNHGHHLQRGGSISVGRPSFSLATASLAGVNGVPPPPRSPQEGATVKRSQTHLQRNLAYLTKYGMNAVASGPGDEGRDTLSQGSEGPDNQTDTFVTVSNPGLSSTSPRDNFGVISQTTSTGSGSINEVAKRGLSRLGSLSFGRQKR